jgi:3',5'-cyclic AMP phosphodiesterase CpdA
LLPPAVTPKSGLGAVAEINRLDPLPDVAVVTGDLVDHGEPPEYEHLRALLAPLAMPVFVIPGNHDAREPLRAAFAADGYLPADGFLQYAIEDYPIWLIALDTLIPGEAGGLLCSERLAWLDHALASAAARPARLGLDRTIERRKSPRTLLIIIFDIAAAYRASERSWPSGARPRRS